jgi:EF hand
MQLVTHALHTIDADCVVCNEILHCHMLCCMLQVKIIKVDFGLTIDIEELINKIDADGSGEIEFEEFKTLLS